MKHEAEVIVIGSGAGGATIARELARAGKDVLILERGRDHKALLGTTLGAGLMLDKLGMNFSKEGLQCVRALTTGGATVITCGTFREPAPFLRDELGIDLTEEVEETRRELGVQELPDHLLEGSGLRMIEAANRIGYHWTKLPKFIDADRCVKNCGGCMLGCRPGAKWSARVYLEDAVRAGATLQLPVAVERVLHAGGKVTGVEARVRGRTQTFHAGTVILAAGGMSSSPILNRSGFPQAGKGIFLDPLIVTYGMYDGPGDKVGTCYDPPMSVGSWEFAESEGFMLAPLIDPWLLFGMQMGMVGVTKIRKIVRYPRMFGIMTKIKDDLDGELYPDGRFSKPLTHADRKKLDHGDEVSREVLVAAGCKPESLITSPVRGAHPGGTSRIGEVVDRDLQTEIEGLFVSDASVFPEALGTPVVGTVVSMNKRLARQMLGTRPWSKDEPLEATGKPARETSRRKPARKRASG